MDFPITRKIQEWIIITGIIAPNIVGFYDPAKGLSLFLKHSSYIGDFPDGRSWA